MIGAKWCSKRRVAVCCTGAPGLLIDVPTIGRRAVPPRGASGDRAVSRAANGLIWLLVAVPGHLFGTSERLIDVPEETGLSLGEGCVPSGFGFAGRALDRIATIRPMLMTWHLRRKGGWQMGMQVVEVTAGEGVYELRAVAVVTPRGITVTACSPAFAHLGATAQAIPRPEPGRTATVSILAVPCHRDEIPAHDIAAALATRFGVPCAASTGFHVEHASEEDLRRMLESTRMLVDELERAIEPLFE